MKRILIADDEPHIIRILKLSLERAGYKVDSASNGEKAFSMLSEDPPDVLISDIQMPRMTGEELCKKIQAEILNRHFPIFIMTSRTERAHRVWAGEIPNLTFMEKPVSARELVATIDTYFDSINPNS